MRTKANDGAELRPRDVLVRKGIRAGVRVSLAQSQQVTNYALAPSQYVREPELRINVLGGIGATTLRRLIDHDGFPPPRRLSERILAWERAAVISWVESRETASPGANPGAKLDGSLKSLAEPVSLAAEGAAVRKSKDGVR